MNWRELVKQHPGQIKTPRLKWHGLQPSAFWKPTKSTTLAGIIPQYDAEVV